MTHSSHRFTTLSADDVALCRAHSRAVASEPDHVVWARECGAPTTQQRAAWSREETYRAACDDFERVTLNQAQSDAYWQWQREVHSRVHIGVDLGAPEGDTTVIALAPAKPAAEQPEPAAEVWHSENPSVAGVYLTRWDGNRPTKRHWDGVAWSMSDQSACKGGSRQTDVHRKQSKTVWLRLIEADKPAQQPAQKASTHSVCIRAYGVWNVGEVSCFDRAMHSIPANWLPCDESGWVTHVPTADAVCPVPDGVGCQLRLRDRLVLADVSDEPTFRSRAYWREDGGDTITHWRPIAQS